MTTSTRDLVDERSASHWFVRGRYDQPINSGRQVATRFAAPVGAYLAMFVGTGFLSGAIVHSGDAAEIPRNALIGAVGIGLFVVGSTFYEAVVLRHRISRRSLPGFLLFSILLSVGIGMISGGVQHFTDFPTFSPKLIPLGLLVSTLAFGLKHRVELRGRWAAMVLVCSLALSGAVYAGTTALARPYVDGTAAGHGGHGHGEASTVATPPSDAGASGHGPEAVDHEGSANQVSTGEVTSTSSPSPAVRSSDGHLHDPAEAH